MAKRLILALLVMLSITTQSFAANTASFENLSIDKVEVSIVSGADAEGGLESQVKSKMKTKVGDFFSQSDFDQDLKNLSLQYDRVDPRLNIVDGNLQITLKVWPKPVIRTIMYNGNNIKSSKNLQKELGINVCSIFDRKSFNEAFHKLKTYYVKKGFFEAELDYDVVYDNCTNEVDININVIEGRCGRIRNIEFCGFSTCEEAELINKMVTKKYNIFYSWFTEEGTFREDAMQHDENHILGYLQNKGYADAVVKIEVTEADCKNRIDILISADRGCIYTVNRIKFDGNCLFDNETIYSKFTFYPGSPYSPEEIRNTISNITDLYGRRGYIDTYVAFEPKLECENSYGIDFIIEEGEQFRIGLIKVFGNCTTQTNIILQETLLIPGEVFNVEKLKMTERRLENIGYFKKVNVYAVKTEGCTLPGNYRDVHIEVDETSTGKFGLFFGFSTTENLFGGMNISENNFNAAGIPCMWSKGMRSLRGGGEFLSVSAQVGDRSRSYNLSWTKPYFMDTKWSVGFDVDRSYNNYISKDIDIKATGFTLRAGRQINSFVRLQTHYRIRASDVDFEGSKKDLKNDPQLKQAVKNAGAVSAVGLSLTYDSTDSLSCPTKGFRSIFETEVAGMGGNYHFWSFSYLNTLYHPFTESIILKLRGNMRFISPYADTSYNELPMDERLFLGGDTLVRGYRAYRIGPQFKKSHIPKGGMSQQFASMEINQKWTKRLDGFIFMDLGHLSKHDWNFNWNKFRGSAGFGFRICLMDSLPPVSLGMGFPINPRDKNEVKRFFLQFGVKF